MPKGFNKIFIYLSFFCLFGLLFVYACLEPYWLEVKRIPFSHPDIPRAFNGFTLAFLSDIHHGPTYSLPRLQKLVEKVNNLQPDLILLGGDYVYHGTGYIAPCFAALEKLQAPYGVYAVLGNHDHWEDAPACRAAMAAAGIGLLDNRGIWLSFAGARIRLGGVGDYWEDIQDITPITARVEPDDFAILLSHNPDFAEELHTDRIDLMLSGHTHGGQVSLFGLYAPLLPSAYGQKYREGIVFTSWGQVIVSRGIGTINPPLRFCTRPQILLLSLEED